MRIKKRIGAFFLMFSLLVPVFVVGLSPRAEAIAGVDDMMIASLALSTGSGYMSRAGDLLADDIYNWWLDRNQAFFEGNADAQEQLFKDFIVTIDPPKGTISLNKKAVEGLTNFNSWIYDGYGIVPGCDPISVYTNSVLIVGGQAIKPLVTRFPYPESTSFNLGEKFDYSTITTFPLNKDIKLGNVVISIKQESLSSVSREFYINGKCVLTFSGGFYTEQRVCFIRYGENFTFGMVFKCKYSDGTSAYRAEFLGIAETDEYLLGIPVTNTQGDLSISAADTLTVPDASAMTEDDVYTIATNVTAETQEEYYQKVLEAIAANSFSATAVTDVPDVPDVPVEGDTTILGVVSNIWEGIKSIPQKLSSLGDFIVSGVTGFLDIIIGILRGIWEAILDFPALLQGIWDAVLDIPQAIGRVFGNVLEKIKELALSLVIPSEATITAIQATFMEKFPIIPDLKSFLDGLGDILKNPLGSAEQLALTPFVNLGNKAGGEYGSAVVNFLDFTWYVEKYKPTVDRVILGVCWCVALWNIHGQVSAVIAGHAVGSMVSADSVPDGALTSKKRGRDG